MIYTGGGRPQGVAYDGWMIDMIYTGGRAPHNGDMCPYEMDDDVIYTGGGHPQGVPLRDG